jgi:hypothetical protein
MQALPAMAPNFLEFLCFSTELFQLTFELEGKRDELGHLEQDEGDCEKDVQLFTQELSFNIMIMRIKRQD